MAAFAGRLVREKGVDILLRAFRGVLAEVPDAQLLIAGDGPERSSLTELARRLSVDGRVSFVGHVTREELESRFDRAWVQVVPSLWREPFGNVAAEALMRGTALIGTDGGGLARLIRESRGGTLVAAGDVAALAEALAFFLGDRARAEEVGATGRGYALRELHLSRYMDWLESLYAHVATSYKSRQPSSAA